MLGVFAANRILNMKTATSQPTGAMIWGVGAALHEEAAIDPRHGYFVNNDLAGHHGISHADFPAIEAVFLEEVDDKTNPLKIKGVGELGALTDKIVSVHLGGAGVSPIQTFDTQADRQARSGTPNS